MSGDAWCIYVSFLECAEIGQVKVPCKPHDTVRHLIIKAKERARMMAPETLNTMHIDAADALVELSGAVLFQVWVCIYAYYTHVHRYIYTVYICTRVCVYTFIQYKYTHRDTCIHTRVTRCVRCWRTGIT